MKFSKVLFGLTGCILGASSLTGCVLVAHDNDPPPVVEVGTGRLTVDLFIEGSQDPDLCAFYDVDRFEIFVTDSFGDLHSTTVLCEEFGVIFDDLPEGDTAVDADILDFNGNVVSEVGGTDGVFVSSRSDVVVEIDFPPGSIH